MRKVSLDIVSGFDWHCLTAARISTVRIVKDMLESSIDVTLALDFHPVTASEFLTALAFEVVMLLERKLVSAVKVEDRFLGTYCRAYSCAFTEEVGGKALHEAVMEAIDSKRTLTSKEIEQFLLSGVNYPEYQKVDDVIQ